MIGRPCALSIAGSLTGVVVLATVLTAPTAEWRNGERFDNRFSDRPEVALSGPPARIWIDTDAACGAGKRVDPDDCLAILHLANGPEIAGISTVFGNAPLEITDATTRRLAHGLGEGLNVHRGAAEPLPDAPPTAAAHALAEALEAGPLTIVTLGPLTNIAAALDARPDLRANVDRIVAVMGRRRGHVFHPSEGNGLGILLGHGPVFRDFNVAQDPKAVATVLAMDVPLVLVPYEAARRIEIDAASLRRLARFGEPHRRVADAARSWLHYWNDAIGRSGFYPFDLVAALGVVEPDRLQCAQATLSFARDETLSFPFNLAPSLIAEPYDGTEVSADAQPPLYCHSVRADADHLIAGMARPVVASR